MRVPSEVELDAMISNTYVDEETSLLPHKATNHKHRKDGVSHRRPSVSFGWLCTIARDVASFAIAGTIIYIVSKQIRRPLHSVVPLPNISVAFIGNSMTYYNDLPRFLEGITQHHLTQKSCLHGDASLTRILQTGSGMSEKFRTPNALDENGMYDLGACTVKQLLLGRDEDLELQVLTNTSESLRNDGTNPCLQDPAYLTYLDTHVFQETPKYNFIVLNDNTRNPGRQATRDAGLRILKSHYVPLFLETGATPVFFDTHAYADNSTEFSDIPTFTSLTYDGYKKYLTLVSSLLPASQAPRLAPVGLAFLTVWEERRDLWHRLFHNFDHKHASPYGTFLTASVIHYTLVGEMPARKQAFPRSKDMSELWASARVMQQADEPPNPFPSYEEAEYLYDVADRVARKRHIPTSLIFYDEP